MRFLADGPSIPDDLLLARDQGRVIFFCGAGVSRARAKLPDFFELARKVVSKLGVDQNSPAYKLIQEAQEIDRRIGVPGVISADRQGNGSRTIQTIVTPLSLRGSPDRATAYGTRR